MAWPMYHGIPWPVQEVGRQRKKRRGSLWILPGSAAAPGFVAPTGFGEGG